MYSRSERICIQPNKATSENLGPGYYDCSALTLQKISSPDTPFLQKAPRVSYFDEIAKNSGPAPGSFDLSDSNVAHREVKAVPFAASKTPRFVHSPSTSPGPGTYGTDNVALSAKLTKSNDKGKHAVHSKSAKKIVWKRKFMPPSIPYGAQASGYEETEDGQLVLRKPEWKTEFDPKDRLVPHGDFIRTNAGTHFGKSAGRRYVWQENTNPSPGVYNLSKPWVNASNHREAPSKVTKCIRFGEYVIAESLRKAIPGPGTYNPQARSTSDRPHCVPFSASPARSTKPPVTPFAQNSQPSDETLPGPCSYDVVSATASKKPMHLSRQPFDSSAGRFLSVLQSFAPGPGEYEVSMALARTPARPSTSVFGCVSPRFPTAPHADTPGPAAYQKPLRALRATIAHLFAPQSTPRAVFLSREPRFSHTPSDTPSPGHYNVAAAHQHLLSKGKLAHHAPTSPREFIKTDAEECPGPSDYNPKLPFGNLPSGSVFRSKLPRFTTTKHNIPAANQYIGHTDLLKKTFNKTLSA